LDHTPTINPVTGGCYVSSGYGQRTDPFTGQNSFHEGLDISAASGTPFCATADGCVTFAGWDGSLGNTVKVDHENGYITVYAHARSSRVRRGQRVRRGEVLGEVGNSGRTTGIHLHYEVREKGRPLNPRRFILEMEG
jgi:murein DD-endopeptidase MepM/ murein hydrolase activator NlpD